jgi:hypothetical protein
MDNQVVSETVTTRQTPTAAPVVAPAGSTVQSKRVVTSTTPYSEFFVSKTNQVIFAFIAIIDLLLLMRFIFLLLGANRVGIVNFILLVTQVFVAPFIGIFPSPTSGASYFDIASLVAILVYVIFGYIIAMLISLFSARTTE